MRKGATWERSVAVDSLVEAFATCPDGGLVTWDEMKRITNRDVTGKDRHLVISARRIALNKHATAFGTIIRVGLQRLKPGEHAVDGKRRVKAIGRAARRGTKVLCVADIHVLTSDQVLIHSSVASVLQAINHSSLSGPMRGSKGGNSDPVAPLGEVPLGAFG